MPSALPAAGTYNILSVFYNVSAKIQNVNKKTKKASVCWVIRFFYCICDLFEVWFTIFNFVICGHLRLHRIVRFSERKQSKSPWYSVSSLHRCVFFFAIFSFLLIIAWNFFIDRFTLQSTFHIFVLILTFLLANHPIKQQAAICNTEQISGKARN